MNALLTGRSAPFEFEADLDPATRSPRMRWNFGNGWTASLVFYPYYPEQCGAMGVSLAAWPTGRCGEGVTEIGPGEAGEDEAFAWIATIAERGRPS